MVQWQQESRLGQPGSETQRRRVEPFLGDGGAYEIEALRDRAAMFDLLIAHMNLMSQDWNLVIREILVREAERRRVYSSYFLSRQRTTVKLKVLRLPR